MEYGHGKLSDWTIYESKRCGAKPYNSKHDEKIREEQTVCWESHHLKEEVNV
jgi:hypothetical protein